MNPLTLETRRMILVAATEEMAAAELRDRASFARLLGARVPAAWPPPLNDETSMQYLHRVLLANPDAVGWAHWYWLLRTETADGVPLAIGNGGFTGPPGDDGAVEVGYSVLEAFHGRGLATEAVASLIGWAFADPRVARIVAHTRLELVASRRVLEKLAFTVAGTGMESGTVRYELARASRRGAPR